MNNLISQFTDTKKEIFKAFNCPDHYFLKCALNAKWNINNEEAMSFLSYSENNQSPSNCVIINRENKPMIFEYENYTMVIVIECIKTAIIFDNANKI